jgi:hypothetical protein
MKVSEEYKTRPTMLGQSAYQGANYGELLTLPTREKKPRIWRKISEDDCVRRQPDPSGHYYELTPGAVLFHKLQPRLSFVVAECPKETVLASVKSWAALEPLHKDNPLPPWIVAMALHHFPVAPMGRFLTRDILLHEIASPVDLRMEKILRNLEHLQELSEQKEKLMGQLLRGIHYRILKDGTLAKEDIEHLYLAKFP